MLKKLATIATMGLLVATMLPAVASAQSPEVTIREEDVVRQAENSPPTDNWVLYTRTNTPGEAAFEAGPGTPPLGSGSLQLKTTSGSDKVYLFNYDYIGTNLSDIDTLSYSTYRTEGSEQQVAALNLQVDVNGEAEDGFTTLVFEPVYNTDQGAVVDGEWQEWDAISGGEATWWSSNPVPGFPNRDTFESWDYFVEQNPDAIILGGLGVNQGGGNPGLTTSIDALTVGAGGEAATVYNFEGQKPARATNKEQCKNEGYKEFQATYKNQGECVSSVVRNQNANSNNNSDNSFMISLRRLFGL